VFPKGLGDLSGMLKQAMQAKQRIEELRESLGNERVEAGAGGGMVNVLMNGKFEVLEIKIDPEVITPDDPEMLETLITAAINEAVRKTQDLVRSKMTELTGGFDIPGITS